MKNENDGKQMQSVWVYGTASKSEKKFGKHPTQKPVSLIERCIRACTDPGDLVLDPFSGNGSTGVAAILQQRGFIGIEQESEYVNIAKSRLIEAYSTPPPSDTVTSNSIYP